MRLINLLKKYEINDDDDDEVFLLLSEIQEKYDLEIKLDDYEECQHYLFLKFTEDYWLEFLMVRWGYSESSNNNNDYDMHYYKDIFHGDGSNGCKELRHTYWGNKDGYIFYLPHKPVIKALEILGQYFD